ncbi:hypothetical protein B0H12DRAFT_1271342 [Mycena haematopus]|nr:hypothetical protein B0H12DRAFT_1271342 [Mycena haematopus]
MQCTESVSRPTPRTSPASRARRRVVCILPPPTVRLLPARSPDSHKSTLLPYYHTSPALAAPPIRPRSPPPPAPVAPSADLRLPPVDPRKARRYCTDFGFARNRPAQPLPPLPPMHDTSSSAASTPQATYAETDSDASSFSQPLDLEFPQPPASPPLRRMQSSPLFTPEETDAVREFLRKRWGTRNNKFLQRSPLSDYSWDAQYPDTLELAGEQLLQPPPAPSDAPLALSSRRLSSQRPPPNTRVIRRATSMADPPTPLLLIETMPPPPPPLPARSLRFQDAPLPSLASAGRQKPSHRANLSVPLMGLGIPDVARPALGTAFAPTAHPHPHHRSTRSQPDMTRVAGGPRSFIDLTPEQAVQRGSSAHGRVKRLLSRASSGFIGWGRALAGKKTAQH